MHYFGLRKIFDQTSIYLNEIKEVNKLKSEIIKILKKHIKTCLDCKKEFLGIAIDGGVNPAHTWTSCK